MKLRNTIMLVLVMLFAFLLGMSNAQAFEAILPLETLTEKELASMSRAELVQCTKGQSVSVRGGQHDGRTCGRSQVNRAHAGAELVRRDNAEKQAQKADYELDKKLARWAEGHCDVQNRAGFTAATVAEDAARDAYRNGGNMPGMSWQLDFLANVVYQHAPVELTDTDRQSAYTAVIKACATKETMSAVARMQTAQVTK